MFNEHKKTDMKKIITIMLITVFTACVGMQVLVAGIPAVQQTRKVNSSAVTNLVRGYGSVEGFEVVSVGSLGLGLVKLISNIAVEDEEDKAALAVLDNLRRVVVVDYEDAEKPQKDAFVQKMTDLLEGAEKIIEVKDEGETLNIYGTCSDKGDTIDDLIVFIPEDYTLICLFGSISADKVADLIVKAND